MNAATISQQTQGVEGMSQNRNSRSVRFTTVLVVFALALGALALAGCGGTEMSPGGPEGTGAPENVKYVEGADRTAVLDAVSKAGYAFDPNMVAVIESGTAGTVVARGPLTKGEEKVAALTVVKGKDGKWAVAAK